MTPDASYPRPHFAREQWLSLDGPWAFSFDGTHDPQQVAWRHEIRVPFAPEAPLSGLNDTGYHPVAWYRRSFSLPPAWRSQRVVLHFGAVDYRATVWVNGHLVAHHEGGHTPFWADISEVLVSGEQVVVVKAEDDPLELDKPRGKQDWLLEPHAIWYPRTTGIWQSVWLEPLSATYLAGARFTPNLEQFAIHTEVSLSGPLDEGLRLELTLRHDGTILFSDSWSVTGPLLARTLHLRDPGIDDARQPFLWSPENPVLFDVTLTLRRGQAVLDEVASYTALRSVGVRERAFLLNGRPYFLRLVLDQGYWQDGLLTAPSPEALKRDVELAKALGFNGVRKHQKIEDPRYLYWADRLGLLVWEELPSSYQFSPRSATRLTREWSEAISRDYSHPCIVAWVPFNESWGLPDLPASAAQRHLLQALYHLTKALDPTRPVVGNDGWEHVVTDLLTVHDYSRDAGVLAARYRDQDSVRATLEAFRPGGRSILLKEMLYWEEPVILSEFGGVRYSPTSDGWGYDEAQNPEELLEKYRALLAAASQPGLAGFCYTQFTDTFQERNGLLFMNREAKVPLGRLAQATRQGGGS